MKHTRYNSEIGSLLKYCKLPVEDLTGDASVLFLEEWAQGELAGVVGIEVFDDAGLLRSLAVRPSYRGYGLGTRLVHRAEAQAAEIGIRTLWLLTDSAAEFFELLDYERAERSSAPEEIKQSAQFRDLCPESAVLMRKETDGI
ncbi:MAG: GNAT family N-acetyltransferase [Bacteroidetes bacterium]|jgi:amino-acid N-acetyltransferase|nr:GNAT family N-acetyltransferase [Bacteroidota bacterium]